MTDCVSLEKAKELKETGYPQDPTVQFYTKVGDGYELVHDEQKIYLGIYGDEHICEFDLDDGDIATPSVGELLDVLPHKITKARTVYTLEISKHYGELRVAYIPIMHSYGDARLVDFFNSCNPDCLADMWIWLQKEGYV